MVVNVLILSLWLFLAILDAVFLRSRNAEKNRFWLFPVTLSPGNGKIVSSDNSFLYLLCILLYQKFKFSCGICWMLTRCMSALYYYQHIHSTLKWLKTSGIWVSTSIFMLWKILHFWAPKWRKHKRDYDLTQLYCDILLSLNFRFKMPLKCLFNIHLCLFWIKCFVIVALPFLFWKWWQLTPLLCSF